MRSWAYSHIRTKPPAKRWDTRAVLWLSGVFATSSLFLAALGIWSVVAYTVGQRRQELGLRMALGARAHMVVALVARGGLLTAGTGLLIGAVAAYAASRLLSSLLFGVTPTAPFVYLIASALFAAVVILASAIPALGAARVDPVRAMRAE